RMTKADESGVTRYYRNGTTLLTQKKGSTRLDFFYDANGLPLGFKKNGTVYYYILNLQGDVVGILDREGTQVVGYRYDPWGKLLSCTGELADSIGAINPLRYRGYYYDSESGLYYLNSRYYDPETGRFLNADSYISTGQGILGHNMFTYCLNNPVNKKDAKGTIAGVDDAIAIIIAVIGLAATATIGSRTRSSSCRSYYVGTANRRLNAQKRLVSAVVSIAISAKMAKGKEESKSDTVATTKSKKQAFFPESPYDFHPIGLKMKEYVAIGTRKNGGTIKWEIPGTKCAIFEWNEDYREGSHYHVMLIEWDNKHLLNDHWRGGMPVPEPWNTQYFSGGAE
ncbi:RHS repeat domain-containing protein, partial [Candidatus Paralachnospira sp. LCP21S3_H12]